MSRFERQWESIDDPKAIRETFEHDQEAEDALAATSRSVELWQSPDGEYFEVSRKLPCGTRVTETGRWIPPEEFSHCKQVI